MDFAQSVNNIVGTLISTPEEALTFPNQQPKF